MPLRLAAKMNKDLIETLIWTKVLRKNRTYLGQISSPRPLPCCRNSNDNLRGPAGGHSPGSPRSAAGWVDSGETPVHHTRSALQTPCTLPGCQASG